MIRYSIFFYVLAFAVSLNAQEVIYTGLENPTSIYTTKDFIYVVESGNHRILKLDKDGNLIDQLGRLGSRDYQFDTPIDIDATNGLKIYVSDSQNGRIQVFDRRFQYLTSIQAPRTQRSFTPTQLLVNKFGELFVYDESTKSILLYDQNGAYRDSFRIDELNVEELRMNQEMIEVIDYSQGMIGLMAQNGLMGSIFPFEVSAERPIDSAIFGEYEYQLKNDSVVRTNYD